MVGWVLIRYTLMNLYQSLVFSDSGTFAYEGKTVYTAMDFNWNGNWTQDRHDF